MLTEDPTLAPLFEALPQGFDFYHLGRIESQDGASLRQLELADDQRAIAYRIEGEARGVLLLLLDERLDTSTYSEAGNIIASRLLSRLADQDGLELTLSPPKVLAPAQIRVLLAQTRAVARSYVHRHGENAIPLQAVLIPAAAVPMEGIGHA